MEINNQIVLVTGGASGMGDATARLLAEHGAQVAIADKNHTLATQVAKEINGLAYACDVSDAKSIQALLLDIKQKLGASPRICINCAGIAPAARIVSKQGPLSLDAFNQVIQVNLIGTFNVLRLVAEQMMALSVLENSQERGIIINTASIAAFEGQIGQAAYSASKGGVVALTIPAAREFAKFGIRVNAIAPGLIETPMLLNMPQKVQDHLAAQLQFPPRFGYPREFAKLAMHLIENSLINGEVIRLDGAVRMGAK